MEITVEKTKLQESIDAITKAKVDYDKAVTDAIVPGLQYIADTLGSKIGAITIIGWTPGFNDGAPCEHSTDVIYGYNDLFNYGLEYLLEEWYSEEEEAEKLSEQEYKPSKEITDFVELSLLPYYDSKNDTNYRVTIVFTDGAYKIEEGEYDCGY